MVHVCNCTLVVGTVLYVAQLNVIDKKQEIAQLRREEEVK
jgi:hypothetical protein